MIAIDPPLTDALIADIAELHAMGWPQSACSIERIRALGRESRHHLLVVYDDDRLIAMAQLIETQSYRRTALLYEELIVHPAARRSHPTLIWDIDAFLYAWARHQYPLGTRIEATVDAANHALWTVHRRSGFDDRRQRALVRTL